LDRFLPPIATEFYGWAFNNRLGETVFPAPTAQQFFEAAQKVGR
jgi:hypothetical protein